MVNGQAIAVLDHVGKHFGSNRAVEDVSLEVWPGEVVCLLGDNGAGKSTLIKVLSGVYAPTSGTVLIDGKPVRLSSPHEARERGIATVYQEVGTIPLMSIGRNFFLGAEPTRWPWPVRRFDRATANSVAVRQMQDLGITRVRDGRKLAGTLSGGECQALVIARALYFGARMLILDEPTSALGVKEAAKVLHLLVQVRSRGVGVVFITHNAQHALSIGDRFVVLIHGRVAATFSRGEKSREEVLGLMAGGEELEELNEELEGLMAGVGPEGDSEGMEV